MNKMNSELKVVALHFEPTKQVTTHFIDSNGKLLTEPDYQIDVSTSQADRLAAIIAEFPSELHYGWMCAPIFRDVLIWEETGRIVRVFELCFECDQYQLSDSLNSRVLVEDIEKNPFAKSVKTLREVFTDFDRAAGYRRNNSLGVGSLLATDRTSQSQAGSPTMAGV